MTTDSNSDDNALALAAVTLLGNKPRGDKPQWQEISAWRAGTLDEPRAGEVLSHIANDPEQFQQWLDLAEAESWVAEEAAESSMRVANTDTSTSTSTASSSTAPKQSSSVDGPIEKGMNWLRSIFAQPLPVYGGAFAAIMLAVLIAPLMRESEMTLQRQLDRSSDTYLASGAGFPETVPGSLSTRSLGGLFEDLSMAEVEQAHFQFGVRQGVERLLGNMASRDNDGVQSLWQEWAAELPADTTYCEKAMDREACESSLGPISGLGQWTVLMRIACEQRVLVDQTLWTQQADVYQSLRTQPALANSAQYAERVPEASAQSPQILCPIADALIRSP